MWDPGEYRKCRIRASTRNGGNPGEYPKCGIRASTGKVEIRASIGNGESERVPEMWDPNVGSWRVPKMGGIQASTGKVGSGPVLEMWDPDEYWKWGI